MSSYNAVQLVEQNMKAMPVMIQPGEKIPDVQLMGVNGRVSLCKEIQGRKVVILTIPGACTPTCSKQIPDYIYANFFAAALDVILIANNTVESMQDWIESMENRWEKAPKEKVDLRGWIQKRITVLSDPDGEFFFRTGLGRNGGKDRGLGFIGQRAAIYADNQVAAFVEKEEDAAKITVTECRSVFHKVFDKNMELAKGVQKLPVEKYERKKDVSTGFIARSKLLESLSKEQKPVQEKDNLQSVLESVTLVRYKPDNARENFCVWDLFKGQNVLCIVLPEDYYTSWADSVSQLSQKNEQFTKVFGKVVCLVPDTVDVVETWAKKHDPKRLCTMIADWGSECAFKMNVHPGDTLLIENGVVTRKTTPRSKDDQFHMDFQKILDEKMDVPNIERLSLDQCSDETGFC